MEKLNKKLLWLSFSLYLFLLVWVIILKCNREVVISDCVHLFYGKPILERLEMSLPSEFSLISLINGHQGFLNILIFVPLGIYLPLLFPKCNLLIGTLIGFSLSVLFETTQLLTAFGHWQYYDFITNTLGYVWGHLGYFLLRRLSDKVLNVMNLIFLAICVGLTGYALVKTIINFDIYYKFF